MKRNSAGPYLYSTDHHHPSSTPDQTRGHSPSVEARDGTPDPLSAGPPPKLNKMAKLKKSVADRHFHRQQDMDTDHIPELQQNGTAMNSAAPPHGHTHNTSNSNNILSGATSSMGTVLSDINNPDDQLDGAFYSQPSRTGVKSNIVNSRPLSSSEVEGGLVAPEEESKWNSTETYHPSALSKLKKEKKVVESSPHSTRHQPHTSSTPHVQAVSCTVHEPPPSSSSSLTSSTPAEDTKM